MKATKMAATSKKASDAGADTKTEPEDSTDKMHPDSESQTIELTEEDVKGLEAGQTEVDPKHVYVEQVNYPCVLTALKSSAIGEEKQTKILNGSLSINLTRIEAHLPVGGIIPDDLKRLLWFLAGAGEKEGITPPRMSFPFEKMEFWVSGNKGLKLKLFENKQLLGYPVFDDYAVLEPVANLRLSEDKVYLDIKFKRSLAKLPAETFHNLGNIVKSPMYCNVLLVHSKIRFDS